MMNGQLKENLQKAIDSLQAHIEDKKCSDCSQKTVHIDCNSCKKKIKIWEVEQYRQCKKCKAQIHNSKSCLLKHRCK